MIHDMMAAEVANMGNFPSILCLILLSLSLLTTPLSAATWHVPADYPTLEEAVEAAQEGDTIQLAPGTYPGPFSVTKGVEIKGNPQAPQNVVLAVTSFWLGSPAGTTLNGLTLSGQDCHDSAGIADQVMIQDCVFEEFDFVDSWGITLFFAEAQFLRCTVRNNRSDGAMFWILQNSSQIQFQQCRFLHNAGGVAGVITQFGTSPVLVHECLFLGNHCTGDGGAIQGGSGMTIDSCRFEANSAEQKGGALAGSGNDPCLILNSTFVGNSAAKGGALAADQVFEIVVENTDFSLNEADVGPQGWLEWGCVTSMTCCQADLDRWAGSGTVTLDNTGCTVGSELASWSQVKAMFR
jgi:predicted outer membrane repeat protein